MHEADTRELTAMTEAVVEQARRAGAEVAEVQAHASLDLNVRVRRGEPERVEEAGERRLALRVIRDGRIAVTSTSDLTPAGLQRCVDDAMRLVELTEPDPEAGPVDPTELASAPLPELDLYDPAVDAVTADHALSVARAAEAAALASDRRLELSEGATYSRTSSTTVLTLSTGFSAPLRESYAALGVTPVAADEGGKRRRGHHWTAARHLAELEPAEQVGREAARRTLARLGARKVATTEAPIVFAPEMARDLLDALAGCLLGSAVWRRATYLAERRGTTVASPLVTVVDDPLRPRAPGSRPFDGEGLPTRPNVVIDRGVLKTFLLDATAARKLGQPKTASAGRSGALITPTSSNFLLEPGSLSPEQLLRSTDHGLYVTELMGFGFNPVTGDFSRGAAGFWIEAGELAFPVGEVTISSTLDAMLHAIDAVANDLTLKTATAAPTLRVATMTIAGE